MLPSVSINLSLQVASVLTFDTVHQMLITHASAYHLLQLDFLRINSAQVYTYLITNFGNALELGNLVWSV
jgi:hypothetical protein